MLPARIRMTLCTAALFAAGLLAAVPLAAQVSDTMTITIPRTERAPQIEDFLTDGRLEPPPAEAPATIAVAGDRRGVRVQVFRQREPGDGNLASQPTAAYLSYDNANLYVVFVCHDEPGGVRANIARRGDIGDDDRVTVYLDTFRARQRAYQFDANPLGIQRDGIRAESTGNVDLSFDEVWSSEGRVVANGYVVRFAIPFRSLRFRPGEQTWGLALGRIIHRENERSFWPHITRQRQGFVSQFGNADGLAQISPSRNMQVIPYAMAARARVLDEDVPDHVNEGDERIGLDAKMVVRDALTLDLTLNPDFSQVETDDPQVTVNERFEVFFPERRPFFLENSDYFQTPEQLFFSRRIIDPGVGFRSTGKMGSWAVGALVMNDRAALEGDDPAAEHDAWIGAARVERELGEESAAGFLVTDREFYESRKADRMFAADARLRLGDNWELIGQAMRSETVEHGPEGEQYGDWGLHGDLSFSSRAWEGSAKYREFGPDFRAPLGFVNRWDYRRVDFDGQYTFWPESDLVREHGPKLELKWLWDHGTGVLQDRELQAIYAVEMIRSTEIEVARVQAYELFEEIGFDLYTNQLGFKTEWFHWLGADLAYAWGTEVNHDPAEGLDPERGKASEAEVGLTLRPTNQLRFEGSYVDSRLHTEDTSEHLFTERLLRARIDYQFSRLLSLRTIFDYGWEDFNVERVDADDPRARMWAIDVLLTYLVNPGTALYVGFTEAQENLRLIGSPPEEIERSHNPTLSVGRQIFVKASYLVRF